MGAPDTAFVRQYQDTIQLLAQQQDARIRPTVMVDNNWTGEKKFYDQYNTDSMVEILTRYQDTPIQAPDHRRRMVTPRYFVSNTLEDPVDALQMLIDPKSTYMTAKKAAANRQIDDLIITAANGTSLTGKDGTVSIPFPVANQIVAGGLGLTKIKVLDAKQRLDAGEVEKDDRYFTHSSKQLEDLLNTTEVTSSDYNSVKALVQGELMTWVGFKWIHTERLNVDGALARLCLAYQKKGIQLTIQKEVEGRVDERPDKNYAWQVYLRLAMGATRLEEARVMEIACVET